MRIQGLLSGLLLTAGLVSGVPVVSVQPTPASVAVGQTFALNVTVSNVTDLFAFQFDLGFDPTRLQALTVTEGAFLATGGTTLFIPGTPDNAAGSVQATFNSLVGAINGVDGSGILATFNFLVLAPGQSLVVPGNITLLDSNLFDIPSTTDNATVNAIGGAVPEPPTLTMAASLMGLLLVWSARLARRI